MLTVSNAEQIRWLFLYLGFGGVLGLVGAAVRAWRRLTAPRPWQVAAQDVVLCTLAATALFLFSLPLSGGLFRAVFLLTAAVGYGCIRPIADRLFGALILVCRLIMLAVTVSLRWPLRLGKKISEKGYNFLKKHLHCTHHVLYNHKE